MPFDRKHTSITFCVILSLLVSEASVGIAYAGDSVQPVPAKRPEIIEKAENIISRIFSNPDKLDADSFNKVGSSYRLSDDDALLYQKIFELQDIGNLKKANEKIDQLSDHMLMGHVLAQRYLSTHYVSTYEELAKWMKKYGDLAGAREVYNLAAKKRPRSGGGISLSGPKEKRVVIGYHNDDIGKLASLYLDINKYNGAQRKIIGDIKDRVAKNPSGALDILEKKENREMLDNRAYDALRSRIAESYFFNGSTEKAYALATVSAKRSKEEVPIAGWIAGLCSWKYKKYAQAAEYFEIMARSKRSSAWMSSAGAYWAARSYLRARKPQKVGYWLRKASENPRSFYGIIAVKALGMENSKYNWNIPRLTDDKAEALAQLDAGKRAIALMDAKKFDYAEKELRQIDPRISKKVQEAMMAVAHNIGAPDFEMRLGSGLKDRDGKLYDAALYPDALWLPDGDYVVDKALVHAFIRQESKFSHDARNRSSGAVGLMQLMPRTAHLVAKDMNIKDSRRNYNDPRINMMIGQKYIKDLLGFNGIDGSLFKLAVSYNAGPGKMANWEKKIEYDNDALLFIESVPASETRNFVEKVLTNYWIYRLKYGKTTLSLEQVASGDWPMYVAD